MKTTPLRTFFLFLLFLAVSFSAKAQSESSNARLFGTLLDSSGAALAGVNVTAQLEANANAHSWKTSSSADGAYTLTLPPGRYHLTFQRSPFVARDFVIDLYSNQQRNLDLTLNLERLSASVIVTAQAEPTLADQTTAPVSVITKQEIDASQWVSLTRRSPFHSRRRRRPHRP